MNKTVVPRLSAVAGLIVLGATMRFMAGCATWKTPLVVLYGGQAGDVALLRIPVNVDIRNLDGTAVTKPFGQDELLLQIGPGSHKAEVRYSLLFPTPSGDFEKIQSDYYVVGFDCLTGGTYRIECTDPRTLEATRHFARAPVFMVIPRVTAFKQDAIPPVKTVPTPPPKPSRPARLTPNSDLSSELKRIWEQASPEERKAFLESMSAPRCETTEPVPAP